ncbi:aspartate/glutamate racemase family protein [Chloroflexota bacterium]
MKTIGLLGGMSWESTALYYRWINEFVKQELGGLHSAQIAMVSVDFQEIEELQQLNKWDQAGSILSYAALHVEAAGADFLLLCTNTMHRVAPQIEDAISIPLLHIADATAVEIMTRGMTCVGLLGTNFTMEQEFYAGRLKGKHQLSVLIPNKQDRDIVHRVIYEELVLGFQKAESREEFLRIMEGMRDLGAEGIIEGCTEIVMLVQQKHTTIPLFDTTAIHARRAVELALL